MYRSNLLKSFASLGAVAALSLTAAGAEAKVLDTNEKHFYVTLNGDGSKKTIARIGSVTIFAQCEIELTVDEEGELDGGEEVEVKILAKNSKGAWFRADSDRQLAAGQRTVLLSESEDIGEPAFEAEDNDEAAVITKSGLYVSVDAGLGLNIFGHDCVAVGTVSSITGKP